MTPNDDPAGATYAAAGVDIAAGDRAVELMRAAVSSTSRDGVIGGLGGFAGLFAPDLSGLRRPLLASSTDGVGTKLVIAQRMDRHDTVGIDLVAMVVDDLVVCGAEPLFLLDYVACGRVVPERLAAIVGGIAAGCRTAGCALVGGETAEHPGVLGPDDYDLSATGVGIVDADRLLGPDRVRPGDAVIALPSSGLHSNGFSLVRHVFADLPLDDTALLGRPLGEELLTPTRIYARDCLALVTATSSVHAFAHVTGGGLAANLARVLPAHVDAVLDRSTWTPAPVFRCVQERGLVADEELERTLNMGVGMVAVVAAEAADTAVGVLQQRGLPAWVLGRVEPGTGTARLVSDYAI